MQPLFARTAFAGLTNELIWINAAHAAFIKILKPSYLPSLGQPKCFASDWHIMKKWRGPLVTLVLPVLLLLVAVCDRSSSAALLDSMGLQLPPNPSFDAYYGLVDFEFWARKNVGDDAVEYLKKNVHPLDLAFRLAEAYGIVLLNGGGFEAPNWSLRVSLANLPDEAYEQIGRGVRLIARGYRDMYEASHLVPAK